MVIGGPEVRGLLTWILVAAGHGSVHGPRRGMQGRASRTAPGDKRGGSVRAGQDREWLFGCARSRAWGASLADLRCDWHNRLARCGHLKIVLGGLFHGLHPCGPVGDQCHPIGNVLAAQDPDRFARPRRPCVAFGMARLIASEPLSAYVTRDDVYWRIWGHGLAHRYAAGLNGRPARIIGAALHQALVFGRHLPSDLRSGQGRWDPTK